MAGKRVSLRVLYLVQKDAEKVVPMVGSDLTWAGKRDLYWAVSWADSLDCSKVVLRVELMVWMKVAMWAVTWVVEMAAL